MTAAKLHNKSLVEWWKTLSARSQNKKLDRLAEVTGTGKVNIRHHLYGKRPIPHKHIPAYARVARIAQADLLREL